MFLTHRILSNPLFARLEHSDWGRYCSPRGVYPLVGTLLPWLSAGALILSALGVYIGLFVAPDDAQRGGLYRIVFVMKSRFEICACVSAFLNRLLTSLATGLY